MKRSGGVSGAVSLVMIFCVLCLAVFSVLTLATADREARLSEMTAQSAADYYAADTLAVSIVAALRDGLPLPADAAELEVVHVLSEYSDGAEETASFSLPAGENQSLNVEVLLRDKGGKTCKILRWQTEYTGSWETEDTMDIWDGTWE